MSRHIGGALGWGWGAVCLLGLLSVGCGDDEHVSDAPPTDFERGTIAAARWDACSVELLPPLSMFGPVGIVVTTVPVFTAKNLTA